MAADGGTGRTEGSGPRHRDGEDPGSGSGGPGLLRLPGGSVRRASAPSANPELAFPQHLAPELAPEGWRPIFIDYLYLGFTNALAFSPTDAMPLVPWTKIAMGVQSLISVAILGLVIARAVNILS